MIDITKRNPISYLKFSHPYMKLKEKEGTTIRMSLKINRDIQREWMILSG